MASATAPNLSNGSSEAGPGNLTRRLADYPVDDQAHAKQGAPCSQRDPARSARVGQRLVAKFVGDDDRLAINDGGLLIRGLFGGGLFVGRFLIRGLFGGGFLGGGFLGGRFLGGRFSVGGFSVGGLFVGRLGVSLDGGSDRVYVVATARIG